MSYAKKTKGYRGITFEGARYRWHFRSGAHDSTVTIQGAKSGGQQAVARFRGCPDAWLAAPALTGRILVTPRTVRRMIKQALARGWQPASRAEPVTFDYEPATHAA